MHVQYRARRSALGAVKRGPPETGHAAEAGVCRLQQTGLPTSEVIGAARKVVSIARAEVQRLAALSTLSSGAGSRSPAHRLETALLEPSHAA